MVNLGAAYSEQASVGDWPLRIGLTLGVVLVVLVILAALRWGWRRRRDRQGFSAVSAGPAPSADVAGRHSAGFGLRVKYLGTARAENLFERVVAGGGPAQVWLGVGDGDLSLLKDGSSWIPISADKVTGVETGRGLLQKSYHRHGVLLVTWRWDDRSVVSGFWIADRAAHDNTLAALRELMAVATSSQGVKE